MIRKTPLPSGRKLKVTFEIARGDATSVAVAGDFNGWNPEATVLKPRKRDGLLAASLTLEAGRRYEFRYCLDGSRWTNDPAADGTAPNDFGSENSVLQT
jgi:1,4-alpha-glucan branching enzyme